jgi:hypothetical protein
MIDNTQASAAQAACGTMPVVCSAQLAPLSAQAASTRCIKMPIKAIDERKPDRLERHGKAGNHLRKG